MSYADYTRHQPDPPGLCKACGAWVEGGEDCQRCEEEYFAELAKSEIDKLSIGAGDPSPE